jgi:hypothetical protein
MTDDTKRALADRSNKLLDALRHLRDTEKRKRQLPVSTPAFHELADEVNRTSNEVYRLARQQDILGDTIPTGSESIDETDAATGARAND